jgi:protein-S-isoprenylcysteine O-methyltransferase Ste14
LSEHKHEKLGEEYPGSDPMQLVMLIAFLVIWAVDSFLLQYTTHTELAPMTIRIPLAAVIAITGAYLMNESHRLVIDPEQPTFIDYGVFSRVRHPMYLGAILIYLAFSTATLSLASLIALIPITLLYDRFAAYEEQQLDMKLGETYKEYKKKVRRWIPFKKPGQV